jgi:ElaB/YqjD/DUF883 family membrane-anchored ribosome-binding protein
MSNTNEAFRTAAEKASRLADDLADRASQAKERVTDFARSTADAVDERRSTAADGFDSAASTLRDRAAGLPGGQPVNRAATSAADRLETTAEYVRTHDVDSMLSDAQSLVKRNPGLALLAAAAFGFLVGRTLSRD